ncbi:MAG: hypothetical protein WAS29_01520, partial [Bacillota bacterium]
DPTCPLGSTPDVQPPVLAEARDVSGILMDFRTTSFGILYFISLPDPVFRKVSSTIRRLNHKKI